MKKNTYELRVPDLMEAIFDVCYLTFDLIAGILFFAFSKGNMLFVLYGILTLTLCGGDAFHLIPCVIRAIRGSNDEIKKQLGIGLQVSSITMTVVYIILYAISGNTYEYHMTRMVAAIMISFGCYLPVTLLSKKMPKIGMLMIPKTCAYVWMIVMGLQLLFRA